MKFEEQVLRYIAEAGGRRVTSDEIRDKFHINETTTGNLNTRTVIKEALRKYAIEAGIPIGADGKGYFLIATFEQIQTYRQNLRSRINGIQERINLVDAAWENRPRN
jgi:hypothetical protein